MKRSCFTRFFSHLVTLVSCVFVSDFDEKHLKEFSHRPFCVSDSFSVSILCKSRVTKWDEWSESINRHSKRCGGLKRFYPYVNSNRRHLIRHYCLNQWSLKSSLTLHPSDMVAASSAASRVSKPWITSFCSADWANYNLCVPRCAVNLRRLSRKLFHDQVRKLATTR